jgi:hypothetical protein
MQAFLALPALWKETQKWEPMQRAVALFALPFLIAL